MGLIDAFVVIGIFAALAYIILSRIQQRSPGKAQKIMSFFTGGLSKKIKPKENLDRIEQVYDERRTMM